MRSGGNFGDASTDSTLQHDNCTLVIDIVFETHQWQSSYNKTQVSSVRVQTDPLLLKDSSEAGDTKGVMGLESDSSQTCVVGGVMTQTRVIRESDSSQTGGMKAVMSETGVGNRTSLLSAQCAGGQGRGDARGFMNERGVRQAAWMGFGVTEVLLGGYETAHQTAW